MNAAILAVGSELLGPSRLDTNSLQLTRLLRRYGVELKRKTVVGDTVDDLAGELARSLGEVDLVIVTGGLGPTADDVTREAAAPLGDVPHLPGRVDRGGSSSTAELRGADGSAGCGVSRRQHPPYPGGHRSEAGRAGGDRSE